MNGDKGKDARVQLAFRQGFLSADRSSGRRELKGKHTEGNPLFFCKTDLIFFYNVRRATRIREGIAAEFEMDFDRRASFLWTQDVEVGHKDNTTGTIFINDIDLRALKKTAKENTAQIKQLKALVEEQQQLLHAQKEMLEALWYWPNMPGYMEGKESFDGQVEKEKEEKLKRLE